MTTPADIWNYNLAPGKSADALLVQAHRQVTEIARIVVKKGLSARQTERLSKNFGASKAARTGVADLAKDSDTAAGYSTEESPDRNGCNNRLLLECPFHARTEAWLGWLLQVRHCRVE